jgi:hypothetical protein
MSKYKYTVVLPDGKEATRTSPRTYSHAIAVKDDRGWGLIGYAGNLDLANKAYGRASKILARHRLMATGNSDVRYGWTEIRMIAVQVREIGKKTAPKPAKAKHHHAGKIRLTREIDAFGITVPGTCHVPNELCDEIMADPAKFISTLVPVGSKGNWINPEPIMHAGKPYWIKVWAPDDDSLVSDCAVFDRDWSKTDPWYL